VAADARRGRTRVPVPHVALLALQARVRAGQGKMCELGMIEFGYLLPVVHAVAGLASGRQSRRHVIQRSSRRLEVLLVARGALRVQPGKHAAGSAAMALVADHRCVSPEQGKPVVVVLNRGDLDVPALHRVALLAVGSELAPVEIRMAFRALGRCFRKDQIHVAAGAGNTLVHTTQRKTGLRIVIEFHHFANRSPRSRGVTALARQAKVPVRIRDLAPHRVLLRSLRPDGRGPECEKYRNELPLGPARHPICAN